MVSLLIDILYANKCVVILCFVSTFIPTQRYRLIIHTFTKHYNITTETQNTGQNTLFNKIQAASAFRCV